MKKYLAVAVTALLVTVVGSMAAPDKAALEAKEKAAWQAFRDKKPDDFKKHVSADLVAVYAEGVMNLQAELDAMSKTTMTSFALSDINVVAVDDNTAVVSYKAKVEAKMDGKDRSGTFNAATVWVMKDGEWRAVFHTDMKAATAP